MTIAAELDAAHERSRQAYARRDAAAYIETFHPDLEYTQVDGRAIGLEALARDIRTQLARMRSAGTEFRRESLEFDEGAGKATETLEQRLTYQVRSFGIVHREWIMRRRGRYEWLRTAGEWKLRRVKVLAEQVLSARTWLSFG
jgi:uncharacterized protein DUF4440